MSYFILFVAAWIAFQIAFVAGAHTVFYVRAVKSGLGWSVQDYFTSLGITLLGALGIWGRAFRDLGAKIVDLCGAIRQKLGAKF